VLDVDGADQGITLAGGGERREAFLVFVIQIPTIIFRNGTGSTERRNFIRSCPKGWQEVFDASRGRGGCVNRTNKGKV
jgi:hypothetical protein